MKKVINIFIALIMVIIVTFCYVDYQKSIMTNNQEEKSKSDNFEFSDCMESSSDNIYKLLGNGINIGNSLDACDYSYFGSSYSNEFQAAIIYNSNPWTSWDASDYIYFNNDGTIELTWQIDKLSSDPASAAGNFAIQIVNHNKDLEGTTLTCNVENIIVKLSDGSILDNTYKFISSYQLTINSSVTEYIPLDISNYNMETKDLIGSSVTVLLKISDFYINVEHKINALERFWGNPPITKELVDTIKNAGFNTVRVPVTYFNHISPDGTIDTEFLDRVEEVVDWVISDKMYCIIDVHHDSGNGGWIRASRDNYIKNKDIVGSIFTQIAERFVDKNEYLILEGLNETVNNDSQWSYISLEDLETMNEWNQLFVDSVRSTGGNNTTRFLLVNTYAALGSEEALNAFVMPTDISKDKIFVGVHSYYGQRDLDAGFETLKKYMTKYNIVIGEWAFNAQNGNRKERIQEFVQRAKKLNIPTIYWDDGTVEGLAILDRKTLKWCSDLEVLVGSN